MATEVVMPALGMAQETGRLVKWLKRDGDSVTKGEALMEVETDKATVEVEAPASGTLRSIAASEGEDIEVGRAIALIVGAGEEAYVLNSASPAPPQAAPAPGAAAPVAAPPVSSPRPAASPKARRLASERGVDLRSLRGSGPGGAVIEDDVLQAGPAPGAHEGSLWRAMAENVTRSWRDVPHFFVIREVDASGLGEQRQREGPGVTFTDLIVKAVAGALRGHPRMNGMHDDVNIGLAVAVPDGLIVPVIHHADTLGAVEISARRRDLVAGLAAGRVRASDLSGGTFTVSNLGMYGVDLFTAIITEGQAGILAVGRISERAVVVEGEVRARPTMLMSLSCDHRRVDGARAAEFMQALVERLEARA